MKKLFIIMAACFCAHASFGQKAMTFDQAREQHIRITLLDSTYKSGVHADSTLAVFKSSQQEAYIGGYTKLLQDLGKYLKENNFMWDRPVRGFNRVYFNKDGRIDYFLYSFRPGQMSPEKEMEFEKLLNKFVKNYRFPLTAPVKFAQCSPVTYMPADK